MAGVGQGFRSRLTARVIYIRSAGGTAVALVQCDLLSGSRILHHKIASLIAGKTDVPARGLLLAGTHTHSGPGNYFSSNFYNICGKTRNLRMDAYRANFEDIVDRGPDPLNAVNPVMTMICVHLLNDKDWYRPAGAFSSFSIHPTAVPYINAYYSADIFGYIAKSLETRLEKNYNTPWSMIHAVVNGTHGDNSPNYVTEVQRLGHGPLAVYRLLPGP
ncbi:MAG: neutral/alkaline non-lysosomal ceramidase N-terminal domain-containing protein [Thermodesulfobacteriota bacterium]|nr:neutral/alkaline non-lysosomal ceramidase N-terminal domain-containing protein [Thermodesulfobacteriota bacterium]